MDAERRIDLLCRAVPPDQPQQSLRASTLAFYGIVICMYRPDHPPPHFHAQYGEHVAQIALGSLEVLSGSLPPRALRLVREGAGLHADELTANWDLAQALEPLVPVEPLA